MSNGRRRRDEDVCVCPETVEVKNLVLAEFIFSFDIGTANLKDVKDEIEQAIIDNMARLKGIAHTYVHPSEETCSECIESEGGCRRLFVRYYNILYYNILYSREL